MAAKQTLKPVYCIGGAAIDYKLKAQHVLTPATSNPVEITITFGGVARNVAENLAYWMNDVNLQCVVGDDENGRKLLEYMRQRHIKTEDCLILKQQKTGQYHVVLNQDGEMYIALSDMKCYDNIDEHSFLSKWDNWTSQAFIFADTNLPAALLQNLLKAAQSRQARLCIDPVSVCKADRLPSNLEGVFLLKPNQEEAKALTGIEINCMRNCVSAGYKLLDRGVQNVVISLGTLGYVIINRQMANYYQTIQLDDVKNVNGAGDAFMAGILYGISLGEELDRACEWGAAAAAFTVQSSQTVAQGISASQLKALINNQKMIKGYQHAQLF